MVAGEMLTLYTAFSRDQPHKVSTLCHVISRTLGAKDSVSCDCWNTQVYVQHCIEREGKEVWQWLKGRKASVYIAGLVLSTVTLHS